MKISIVLTVYNGEKDIERCLNSLINQTYNNKEIIVIDDCSSDSTLNILNLYSDSLNIIKNTINLGRSASRNIGIKKSSGEIIVFTEDDAVYDEHYIENSIKHFANKEVIGVVGPYTVMNKNENIITKSIHYERILNLKNYKPFSMWFYRKYDLEKIGGFDENLEFGEDIVPYKKLKNNENKVIFEKNAKWQHKEPSKIKQLLKRKYKGGLGMAGLYKSNYESLKKSFIFLMLLIILSVFILFLNIKIFIQISLIIALLYLIINYKNIIYIKKETGDTYYDIILGFYIKFLWRSFTIVGYNYGLILNITQINSKLRGR